MNIQTQNNMNSQNKNFYSNNKTDKYEVIMWDDTLGSKHSKVNVFSTMGECIRHLNAANKAYDVAVINIYEEDERSIKEVIYLDRVNGVWETVRNA